MFFFLPNCTLKAFSQVRLQNKGKRFLVQPRLSQINATYLNKLFFFSNCRQEPLSLMPRSWLLLLVIYSFNSPSLALDTCLQGRLGVRRRIKQISRRNTSKFSLKCSG